MATAQQASELKQQGAIDAAGDPNSNVTADDAQRKVVEESKNAGVAAYTFDPDASPEEKRAQIRAVSQSNTHSSVHCWAVSDMCRRTSHTTHTSQGARKA